MKKYIIFLIFSIFINLSLFCNDFSMSDDIRETVEQFITENKLPIIINGELIIYDELDLMERIKFQAFILDLINIVVENYEVGVDIDEFIQNIGALYWIYNEFYNFYKKNNYELAIIFDARYKIVIDYLDYHKYKFSYYNSQIVIDNDTCYTKFDNLIDILKQIYNIAWLNSINFCLHDWDGEKSYIYKKMALIDGNIEITDVFEPSHSEATKEGWVFYEIFNNSFDLGLMGSCHMLIKELVYLLKIKNYDVEIYEEMQKEIIEKSIEYNRIKDEYYMK